MHFLKNKETIMKSSIKQKEGLKRQLELLIPIDDVTNSFSKSYLKIQKTAKMPGFRQGKIPLQTLKQKYQANAYEAVTEDLFQSFYSQAVKDNNLNPAGPPKLINLDLQEGKACTLTLDLEVHPQIQVTNYLNLKLKAQNTKVQDKEITETLEKLRQSFATFKDFSKNEPLQKGDCCTIDIESWSLNKTEKLLDYKNLLLEIGKNLIDVGFDDHLLGLKLKDSKSFHFAFQKHHPNLKIAGQNLLIKVTLTAFKQKEVPKLDDDLAKKFHILSLKELKQKVSQDLENNLKQKNKEKLETDLILQLIKSNPLDLPQSLIHKQKKQIQDITIKKLNEHKMSLEKQENFLKEKDSEFEKQAKESLHISYLVEQLIQDLNFQVTQKDQDQALEAAILGKTAQEAKKELQSKNRLDSFMFNLTRQKLIQHLVDKAHIS